MKTATVIIALMVAGVAFGQNIKDDEMIVFSDNDYLLKLEYNLDWEDPLDIIVLQIEGNPGSFTLGEIRALLERCVERLELETQLRRDIEDMVRRME